MQIVLAAAGATGVRTLRTQDTSDLRQFGTSAEVSNAEVSVGHFGPFIKCRDNIRDKGYL